VPSLADLRHALRRRTRAARYVAEDAGYAARRFGRRLGSGAGSRWSGLTLRTRMRIAAGLGALAVIAVLVVVLASNLPCQFPGGQECQPDDEAIALVPADAPAYAHVAIDPDTRQYEDAAGIADRLPRLAEQAIARLPGPSGAAINYRREVTPWLGAEAALALVPAGGGDPLPTVLLEVGDEQGAERFVERLGARATQVGDFVVVGREPQVRRVVDTESEGRSLEDSDAVAEVRDGLPDLRLAELYVTEEGADELLGPGDPLGSFEIFVDARATRAAGAALVVGEDDLEIAIHSALDPERAEGSPGFFAAFPEFDPALSGEVSEDALAYLALGDPEQSIAGLLDQATAEAPSLAEGFEDVGRRLRESGNVSLEREILPLLTSQAAVVVEPRGGGGQSADGTGVPYVSMIVDDVDEERANRALARLQRPIAKALDPGRSLQAPVFQQRDIDGVPARSLRISATVDLTYALIDGKLVVSTDPAGVRQVARGGGSLDDSSRFDEVTEGFPDGLSALAYLNLGGLLNLAEQAGLGADPAYAPFSGELRKLEGVGVAVEHSDEAIDTEIRLTIGD
jgi:hypothetical protein